MVQVAKMALVIHIYQLAAQQCVHLSHGQRGPEFAALSMSGSTVLVALDALLLKRTPLSGRVAN
jgi:cation transport ATPase